MPSINVLCFVTTYLNSQTGLTMVKHRVLKHCLQHWFLQTNTSPRGNAIWWSLCLHVSNYILWFISFHFSTWFPLQLSLTFFSRSSNECFWCKSLFLYFPTRLHLVSIASVSDVGEAGCPVVRIVPGRVEMLRLQPELTLVNRTNTTKTDSRSLKPVLIFISLKYIYLNNFMKNAEYLTLPLS